MNVDFRPITSAQLDDFCQTMAVPLGFDPTDELNKRFQSVIEVDRLRAAFDGEQMVGTLGAYSLQLTVPGGQLATAGTTLVAVLPTHRRQGVMRTLVTAHLNEAHQQGEALAALWASESHIYGRFGYGPASELACIKLAKPFAVMQQPLDIRGSMRLVSFEEAIDVFPRIFNQAALERPGMFVRGDAWWRHRVLSDPENLRQGRTAHRRVVHMRNEEPVGYVLFRSHVDRFLDTNVLQIIELVGVDAAAEKALWQFIFGVDLTTEIRYWNQPVDAPLGLWLEQPRRIERAIEDSLWLRRVNLVAALNGRRYCAAGSLVFRMQDELCPWNDGVFSLKVDAEGHGRCEPGGGAPQVTLTPACLGAAYLGGTRFGQLVQGGLMTGTDAAVRQMDAMFSWNRLPWCQEVF